jgi:cation:H+ antiporter
MAVAISAVKLGFLDMALGNIFGSNMFNMGIIAITDLCLGEQVILSSVSSQHLFSALFVIFLTGVVMTGLVYRSKKETAGLAWDSVTILFVYFAANLVNFYLR